MPHVAVCVDKTRSYGRGILLGIGDYLDAYGPWSIFLERYSTGELDLKWLRRWEGDGILAFVGNRRVESRLRRISIPSVDIYGVLPDVRLPQVTCDNVAVGQLGAEHLFERGFSRLAFSGPAQNCSSEGRYRGFSEVARKHGCHCEQFEAQPGQRTPGEWERTQQTLVTWIEQLEKPVGLMTWNDPHAREVLDACRRADVAVPEEVAVLGVDNDEELCRLTTPSLSSIVNNSRKIGFEAARLLDRLMSDQVDPTENMEPILIPPHSIVTRLSTEITAIEDPMVAEAISYIRVHACDGISVAQVAEAVRVSRKTLYRSFEKTVGRSPHQEILHVQLARSKTLLTQTSRNLDEIARMTGFSTASYFSVVFKREMGTTPGQYRAQHKKAAD